MSNHVLGVNDAIIVFRLSSSGVKAVILRAGGKEGDAQMLLGFWKFVIAFVTSIIILEQVFHLGALLAVFGAFGGMLMGWSLQHPVSGFTAWLMTRRPSVHSKLNLER